jgi:hypothetical protein
MKLKGYRVFPVLLPFLIVSFFVSCKDEPVTKVEREKLFTLSYGRFEDQIDLFQLDSNSTGPDTQMFMKDGMFYIANSGSKKILQLTSFGDLLSVYYNPDSNPVPSFAAPESSDGSAAPAAATQKAIAYPFNHPVFLTVDSRKRLFVVDQVPSDRVEYDNDEQVVLRDVVLRFNSDGRFMDYIGQEGTGGTPFPPVVGIYNNSQNETIVVTKNQTGLKVFWYDPEGALLFRIPIDLKSLPSPYDRDKVVLPSLEKVIPDADSRRIYLKIDYYVEVIDSETKSNAGITYDRSCLYPFDIDSGKYGSMIDIPAYEGVEKDNIGTVSFKKPYELIGITASGWLFLSTPVPGGYTLEILDSRSRRVHRRTLSVSDDELAYNVLTLSTDGILSALLATPNEASFVWWRTDALIGEIRR